MKKLFVFFFAIICIGNSCSDGNMEPIIKEHSRLPFDEFWLSTSFGIELPPGTYNGYYFNTWAILRINSSGQDYYKYSSTNTSGIIPNFCQRTYSKTNDIVTAKVNCKLQKQGTVKPSDSQYVGEIAEWVDELNYEVEIVANFNTLKVSSAKITFIDYGQIIDFTEPAEVDKINVNGYDQLIIGGGDYLVTTMDNYPLYIRCVFSERLN